MWDTGLSELVRVEVSEIKIMRNTNTATFKK